MMLFATPEGWGQSEFLRVDYTTKTNNSIVRSYGTKKLVYVENIVKRTDGLRIRSCSNRFILTSAECSGGRVAYWNSAVNNSYKYQVSDVKILGDTAYFCGYWDNSTGSDTTLYGFIGYFSIPGLFWNGDSIQVLKFNPYPNASNPRLCINQPMKIEPLAVDNGVHILCVGRCGNNSHVVNNSFIADIVHHYPTDLWWYYDREGGENFSDITLTDNFAASVGPKENKKTFYLRVFNKPQSVSYSNVSYRQDSSFFYASTPTNALPAYYSFWTSATDYLMPRLISNICSPHITHTEADSVAVTWLEYARHDSHLVYGATVKHFSLQNFIYQLDNTSFGRDTAIAIELPEQYDADISLPDARISMDGTEARLGDGIDWDASDEPLHGEGQPDYEIPIYYNRMIVQDIMDTADTSWAIKDVAYNHKQLFLLQPESYRNFPISEHYKLFSFDVHDTAESVKIMRPMSNHYIRSISKEPYDFPIFNMSGYAQEDQSFDRLILGHKHCFLDHCMDNVENIATFNPQGVLGGRAFLGGGMEFNYGRAEPINGSGAMQAFTPIQISVTIDSFESELECGE